MWRFPLNILIKFKKLNLEPTDKWPVLKFDKSIYFKTKTGIEGQATIPQTWQNHCCYANFSNKLVKRNFRLHNPDSPLLIGDVKDEDVVKEVNEPSYIDAQARLI